jgi:hypothetical protein
MNSNEINPNYVFEITGKYPSHDPFEEVLDNIQGYCQLPTAKKHVGL